MEDVLRKILALNKTNNEIIERVETQETIAWFTYEEVWDEEHRLRIVESAHSISTAELLGNWSTEIDLETELFITPGGTDFLTELKSFSVLKWESAKRLNEQFLEEANKLACFMDPSPLNPSPEKELRKYLRNLEAIQVALGSVEEEAISHPSQLQELTESANVINAERDAMKIKTTQLKKRTLDEMMSRSLLTQEEFAILKGWYCNSSETAGRLRLLYCGSRDGMEPSIFHRLCDDQGPTVTVVRCADGYKFGGYTTASWGPSRPPSRTLFKSSRQTSIFTLTNPEQRSPQRFPIKDSHIDYAITVCSDWGPGFGSECGDLVLLMRPNRGPAKGYMQGPNTTDSSFQGLTFPLRGSSEEFTISDLEVYAVV